MIDAARDLVRMQDFILGRLPEAESRAFEDRLVREPALVRELEQSLRMGAGLAQLRREGALGRAPARQGLLRPWRPLLAAAAVAGVAVFLWLSRAAGTGDILLASSAPRASAAAAPLVAAHFTFLAMRGGSVPDLDLPASGLIEIRAAPGTHESGQRYRLTLGRHEDAGSAKPVASVSGLRSDTDGYVHCYAVASRLTPGSYVLRIQPDTGGNESAESFRFNLRAGAAPAR
ncbi:MAG TPA: hypothetical protein VMT66_14790 [Steroidobacteraceae bacterium]|nr:hypothetical protein [Steroidobacteraceae bacterium]